MRIYFVLFFILSSCCNSSSRGCSCNPEKPFVNNEAISWISPLYDQNTILINQDSIEVVLHKKYIDEDEYLGGDECGSVFKSYGSHNEIVTNSDTFPLFYVKALKNDLSFYSTYYLGVYNVEFKLFNNHNKSIKTQIIDSLINNQIKKTIFIENNSSKYDSVAFQKLYFAKGIGIISFTDSLGKTWKMK